MKVLLVCPNRRTIPQWAPFFEGLAAQSDMSVHVLTSRMIPSRRHELETGGYYPGEYEMTETGAVFQKLSEKGHSAPLVFASGLNAVVRELGPDVVYIIGEPGYFSSWQTVRACQRYAPDAKTCSRQAQNIYKQWPFPFSYFERYCLQRIDCVFANGRQQAEVLARKGYRGRVELMPLGVDSTVFHRHEPDALRVELGAQDAFLVGYVGKLTEAKGIADLLTAFRQLPETAQLLVVGTGELGRMVADLADEPGLEKRVHWIKGVAHTELPRYLSAMDTLVLPSVEVRSSAVQRGVPIPWREQFGRVLVEAMACQVPIVGSSSGLIPEVIGEAGATFREGDVGDLVAKLLLAMNNDQWRERCARDGLKQVKEKYSWHRICRRYAEVFRELVEETRQPPEGRPIK